MLSKFQVKKWLKSSRFLVTDSKSVESKSYDWLETLVENEMLIFDLHSP